MKKDMLIVVPYRDRERDLKKLLEKTPEYFNKQNLSYDILICELEQNHSWNAGMSCNGLIDFIKDREYEWLYIHHVDVIPVDGEWKFPEENQVYYNLGDHGSCLMKMDIFLEVGGYSNSFWGWGAEDNDLNTRLVSHGFKITPLKESDSLKYDVEFQNHARDFDGINYANNVRILFSTLKSDKNGIHDFHKHAYTKDLTKISNDIYKLTVVPTVLCARKHINKNVLITYLKNKDDFKIMIPYVKSSMLYSGYSYDLVVCIADENPNEHLISELLKFGVKIHYHKVEHNNLFIDRYHAYKNFLTINPHYEKVLHTDSTDVVFQSNPFYHINDEMVISSEDVLVMNQSWNTNIFKGIYNQEIYDVVKDRPVLCGGIIGGPINDFINFCNIVIDESKKLNLDDIQGFDQPILQKLIYFDKTKIDVKTLEDAFCVNLHVYNECNSCFVDKIKIVDNKSFINKDDVKFSIVHQYNRMSIIYNAIRQHFISSYYPL